MQLSTTDHNRNIAGLTYIYPVLSRRAGGLSIGINFNTNNACNWRCLYCQVPNLKLGSAPTIDFQLLEQELRYFLNDVLYGDFFQHFQIEEGKRVIKDIAISGNGEPTSVKDFDKAVALIGNIATELGIFPHSHFVLITNGSLIHRLSVQEGLKKLSQFNGEVWFKLDSATKQGRDLINNAGQSCRTSVENLLLSARLCPTKIQTCLIKFDKQNPSEEEKKAYLDLLTTIKTSGCEIKTVMLYSLARASLQPESNRLERVSLEELNKLANDIRLLGFDVLVA